MTAHEGPGHGDVALSLSGLADGGGLWHQSWTVCECTADFLKSRLGPPQRESTADAEGVIRVAEFVRDAPGHVHMLDGGR